MKHFLLFVVLIVFPLSGSALQVIGGRVIDSDTGEGIPYVNIGIILNGSGTVSDENGKFSIKYKDREDNITFSAIGYESLEKSVAQLKEDPLTELSPVVYDLEEVSVSTRGYDDARDLGHVLRKRGQSIGFGSTMLGTEIGGFIEINRETVIYSAHFAINHINRQSLLLRVNLYEFQDGEPQRNLIPENVIIRSPDEPGVIDVDLSEYDIMTEKDVLLSLEWIKGVEVDSEQGTQGITFRAKNVR